MTGAEGPIGVAMVGPYPLEEGKVSGGIEGVAAALTQGLRALPGVELQIITASPDSSLAGRFSGPGLTVVPQSNRLRRLTFYRQERRRTLQCIRNASPDVVHVQGQNWFAMAALASGYPTVVTLHGMLGKEAPLIDRRSALLEQLSKRMRGLFNARFEGEVLRRARHIIVISPYVQECIEGRAKARLYHIPNPIDDAFFEVDRPGREAPDRLLLVASLEPRKGLYFALEALAALRQRRPQVRLRIVGPTLDAGYARALRRYVSDHGLEGNVRFLGFIDQQQLLREYAECCLLLLTSREETSPLAVQQAMAAGRAVVATSVGGIPHLIDDGVRGGLLAPWGDVASLVNAVDLLLSDRALRLRLGDAGKKRALARFRIDIIARQTVDVYRQVMEQERHTAAAAPLSVAMEER